MDASGKILLALGVIFLVGFACHELGKRTHVPRVTLLLLAGAIASPNLLDIVPLALQNWFPYITQMALCLVGFLLGEQFVYRTLTHSDRAVWSIALMESLGAAALVFATLYWLGLPIVVALLLAGIAPASAPAAIMDVVKESRLKGPLPKTLLQVVAIDDFLGILLFALCLSIAQALNGSSSEYNLMHALWGICGALFIGLGLGWPMAKLTGRLTKGEPMLIEALGFVFLCGGCAVLLNTSYLVACIALGATVANLASHHKRPFHAIEGISTPLLIVFFLMAGFQFDITEFKNLSVIGAAYIIARSVGLIAGSYLGASIGGANRQVKNHLGWCLLPQAGVALGLALIAVEKFPIYNTQILSLLVATTIVFELIGPLLTKAALTRGCKTKQK